MRRLPAVAALAAKVGRLRHRRGPFSRIDPLTVTHEQARTRLHVAVVITRAAMRWEWPEPFSRWPFRGILYFLAALTLISFVFTWMGYGNCPLPKCWGDPIPFTSALAKLPKITFAIVVATVIAVVLFGLRSGRRS